MQNAEIKQIKLDVLRFYNKSAIFLYKKCKKQVGSGRKRLLRIFNQVAHQRLRNGKGASPFLFHSKLWNKKLCQAREGKQMTKKFSVLQRAAALLAALCLLAGLALPVCAEGAADALSAQNVETMQQGNDPTAETLTGEQTDEDKTAPDGAAAATPTPTPTPSAGSYILPDSAARRLTQADVANLTWEQCCLARNEIFARHGRIFQTPQIAAYFEAQSWYHGTVPGASFDNNSLSPTERANADFLANYENATWGHSYY